LPSAAVTLCVLVENISMAARIGAALIDLSGTLHVEDSVIPGAIEALRRFAFQHLLIIFVFLHFVND